MFDKMQVLAAEDGYELAYGEEAIGSQFFGMQIYVKMSERKLCDKDSLYSEAEAIKTKLQTVTAELDPAGVVTVMAYRQEIADIYKNAGVDAIYMEQLPNGYCTKPCCLHKPWFRVTSKIGHVVIGWRRSVMSIDWKDSSRKASGDDLFPNDNVTRWETGIHAWGAVKASEYIRRLHENVR